MNIIAFTGLHGTGKTFLTQNISKRIDNVFCVYKRTVLREMYLSVCKKEKGVDWETWYRKMYQDVGGYRVMEKLFAFLEQQRNVGTKTVVLDSIHNIGELEYLKQNDRCLLVLVVAPKTERKRRLSERDRGLSLNDFVRVSSAHSLNDGRSIKCLYSKIDWSLCNFGSEFFLEEQIRALFEYTNIAFL